ncbi:DUF2848 domain-containing protein [Pusillimonas sp. TS35]|uniref:DUF2848 domain-containing protein n=1 Tax=Paracandidimonas lactea TaxID=2895524 RepID=UPI00136F0CB2|nr:DUF2848 domain-containing protein [Paracandidimonas lactea]MYN14095.1 DUF2848 domain-containing protein [Pusillimonas sp. TS35]
MKLQFQVPANDAAASTINVDIDTLIIAGWAGRDRDAIEHHIQELAELGVPRPSAVPLFYQVAANQLIQSEQVQVVGAESSGEAEAFVFTHSGHMYVSLASDHTDRKLEAHSVALSKQLCIKPVATEAWTLDSVADHWDQLILRAWIEEGGKQVLYQEGPMSQLRPPLELIRARFGSDVLPEGHGMTCGTVTVQGGIRPAAVFTMELHDPVLGRSIRHRYTQEILPEIA